MKNKNTIQRAHLVRKLLEEHYEPGRQDRCKLWVFRNVIREKHPISETTFFRYLKIEDNKCVRKDGRQLELF